MHPSYKLPKIFGLFVIAGLVLSFMQFSTVQAASTSTTYNPVADAYVSQSSPSSNYGSSTTLRVDNSPVTHSYLRFSVIGFSGPVSSATLKIYANSSQTSGFNVEKLSNNSWIENGINFSNAPAAGAVINKSAAVTGGTWVSVNVSPYITGNGTYNLVLTSSSSQALSLASREDKTHAPQLVLSSTTGGATPLPPSTLPTATPKPGTSPTPLPSNSKDPIIFFNGDLISSTSYARGQLSAKLIQHLMSLHPGVQNAGGRHG
jgi:acid phosphatase type 7